MNKRRRARAQSRKRTRELFWVLGFAAFGLAAVVSCWQKRGQEQAAAPEASPAAPSPAAPAATPTAPSSPNRSPPSPKSETPLKDSQAGENASPDAVGHPVCLWGCPRLVGERSERNRWVFRPAFILSNNPITKFADLVAYRVSPGTIGKSIRKSWRADPELPPEETLEPEDYKNANRVLHTDRGHLVPLASLSALPHPEALGYLSNVTPQRSILNQNTWTELEVAVRDLVLARPKKTVFVITGPLFEREMPPLPEADEPHRVPSGYFKIVAWQWEGTPEVAAFIMDQETPADAALCSFQVSVRQVEKRAQIDVFSELPDPIEDAAETGPGLLASRLGCATAPGISHRKVLGPAR